MVWFVSLVFLCGFSQLLTVFHFSQFVRFHFKFLYVWWFWSFPLSRFRMFCFQFDIFNRYVSTSRDVVIGLIFFDRFDVLSHDVSDDDFFYSDVSGTMSLR